MNAVLSCQRTGSCTRCASRSLLLSPSDVVVLELLLELGGSELGTEGHQDHADRQLGLWSKRSLLGLADDLNLEVVLLDHLVLGCGQL